MASARDANQLDRDTRSSQGRGNSGIFYRATEATGIIYENAPEMQVLDNKGHRDGGNSLTSAGANYALDAPVRDVTRPVGEWNQARLVVVGPHVGLDVDTEVGEQPVHDGRVAELVLDDLRHDVLLLHRRRVWRDNTVSQWPG